MLYYYSSTNSVVLFRGLLDIIMTSLIGTCRVASRSKSEKRSFGWNGRELIGRSDKGGVRAGEIIIITIKGGASKIEVAHGVGSMTRELGKKNCFVWMIAWWIDVPGLLIKS